MDEFDLKKIVRRRDGMKCTKCGMTNADHVARYTKSLHVHRLQPGSKYTVDGCVTLCIPCHGPEPRRPRGTRPVAMIDADLYDRVAVIAARNGRPVSWQIRIMVQDYIDSKKESDR